MSARDWKRAAQANRMRRHGTEERDFGDKLPPVTSSRRAPVISKEQMRREADRLLAGNSWPITKVPAGVTVDFRGEKDGKPFADTRKSRASTHKANRGKKIRGDSQTRSPVTDLQLAREVLPGLVIYCDGACEPNPGAGGWGFVVYRDGVEIHSECGGDPATTNNIMEMTGALMALRWFAARGVVEPVRLLCDSQYVVKGCNEWRHGWKKKGWKRGPQKELANADLWRELDEALAMAPIALEWCKGHAGIIGNERADELSLLGRERALVAADSLASTGHEVLPAQQLSYSI